MPERTTGAGEEGSIARQRGPVQGSFVNIVVPYRCLYGKIHVVRVRVRVRTGVSGDGVTGAVPGGLMGTGVLYLDAARSCEDFTATHTHTCIKSMEG